MKKYFLILSVIIIILILGILIGVFFISTNKNELEWFYPIGISSILFVFGFIGKYITEIYHLKDIREREKEHRDSYLEVINNMYANNKLDKMVKSYLRLFIYGGDKVVKQGLQTVIDANNGQKTLKDSSDKGILKLMYQMRLEFHPKTKIYEKDFIF